jgi:hypothetical protein
MESNLLKNTAVVKTLHTSTYYSVIEMFHSLPHLNMWFVRSNSSFNPNDSEYLEVSF